MARSRPDPFRASGLVTLTTDFGLRDGYVGAMKGVLLSIDPGLRLVDVAHDLPPQDVRHAAVVLRAAAPRFPAGTVHLAVIDPGVGGERAPLALLAGGHAFVGPDNGLFALAAAVLGGVAEARRIERTPALSGLLAGSPSATFHGRDVFAPVAGALASGRIGFADAGALEPHPQTLDLPRPWRSGGALLGEIVHVDRFGNAVTNMRAEDLPGPAAAMRAELAGGAAARFVATYAAADPGELVALVGSEGFVEIAVRDGSARAATGIGPGDAVRIARSRR
jgi:S-adenosylmethionine hydrolase